MKRIASIISFLICTIICFSACDASLGAGTNKLEITEKGNDESNMGGMRESSELGGLITEGEDKIYYFVYTSKNPCLMSMDKDGRNIKTICEYDYKNDKYEKNGGGGIGYNLNYMGGYLYYVDFNHQNIIQMKADGSDNKVFINTRMDEKWSTIKKMVVFKDKIVWEVCTIDKKLLWYVYKFNEKSIQKVGGNLSEVEYYDSPINVICFDDEWIYYQKGQPRSHESTPSDLIEFRKMRYDGSEDSVVISGSGLFALTKVDNKIMCYQNLFDNDGRITGDGQYKTVDLNQKKEKIIWEWKSKNTTNSDGKEEDNETIISTNTWGDKFYYIVGKIEEDNGYITLQTIHEVNLNNDKDTIVYKFDQKNKTIYDLSCDFPFQFVDGWLYFMKITSISENDSSEDEYAYCKLKLDGSVMEEIPFK